MKPPLFPPMTPPRDSPIASISSINAIAAPYRLASFLALLTNHIIFMTSTPINMARNPEPSMEINATPASPAIAFASMVLPVPGGPYINNPLMYLPPIDTNFLRSVSNPNHWRTNLLSRGCPQ